MSLEDGKKDVVQDTIAKENSGAKSQNYLVSNIIIVLALVIVAGAWFFAYKTISGAPSGVAFTSSEGDFVVNMPEEWITEVMPASEQSPVYGVFSMDETQEAQALVIAGEGAAEADVNLAIENVGYMYANFGFEFITKEERVINGVTGIFYEANLADPADTYYQTGFVAVENGYVYTVITQCKTTRLDELKSVFQDTINSFKITK